VWKVFLEKVQLLLVVDVKLRRHRSARSTTRGENAFMEGVKSINRSKVVGSQICSQRGRNEALRQTAIGRQLTGKKLSESSFCFANSLSSSSSMSKGTAPELRRAAELSPPRPPPRPPRPPRDIL
jgi:hypothetical protein